MDEVFRLFPTPFMRATETLDQRRGRIDGLAPTTRGYSPMLAALSTSAWSFMRAPQVTLRQPGNRFIRHASR